jgi:hypothetical protein
VNTVGSELVAVSAANALEVLSEASEAWNTLSALFSVPTAEIFVVTVEVCEAICASCGARVAATSCETRLETLMTDPPAPLAVLLAETETVEGSEVAIAPL